MAFFDLPLPELLEYHPSTTSPADLDSFWEATLAETRQYPIDAVFSPVDCGLRLLDTYDVTFRGYGGQQIKGWFISPRWTAGSQPCVVQYIGYGGGRGFPHQWLLLPAAGFSTLVMDTRGQGAGWCPGDTSDIDLCASGGQVPGFLTRGVLDPATYYYRRLYMDAVRAVEAARSHPRVDATRIAVRGGSQGGGLSLAVASLLPDIQACLADVPFLCHIRRATQITDCNPYAELALYCHTHRDKVETVFQTIAYFDLMNLVSRAQAAALFSVGLMDDICPPSTVFAAYNNYGGPKQIRIYEYNRHEGGDMYQEQAHIDFLHALWG